MTKTIGKHQEYRIKIFCQVVVLGMALFSGVGARSIQAKLQLYKDDDEEDQFWFFLMMILTVKNEQLHEIFPPQRMWLKSWVKLSQAVWTWVQWSICEEPFLQMNMNESFEKLYLHPKIYFLVIVFGSPRPPPSSWLSVDLNPRWVRVLILARASNEANLDTTEYKCGLNVDDQIWCKYIRIGQRLGGR